eukprot:TRINITY_DN8534_c0_g1_i11.p1 TRINITY_DN8534_c0_g1~~TRINITY_DN8534_c0_g1_i11.p1  ORF type:complete len:226 (+),score=37.45 TRINITY_DN8534_c0_g1_i11:583-1260(+)
MATKKALNSANGEQHFKTKKKNLIEFVDEAILYGHNCRSKRGRKRKLRQPNTSNLNPEQPPQNELQYEFPKPEMPILKADSIKPANNAHKDMLNLPKCHFILATQVHNNGNIGVEQVQAKIECEGKEGKEEEGKRENLGAEEKKEEPRYEAEGQPRYLSLQDPEFLHCLLVQNDSILNEYEELTRDQTVEDCLDDLLELEKEMEKRLKATQNFLNSIPKPGLILA